MANGQHTFEIASLLFAPRAYLVVAAVHVEVTGKRDTTNEEEEGVECIRCDHEEWRDGEGLADGPRNEVE